MKKIIVTYDDVVAGDAPVAQPAEQNSPRRPAKTRQDDEEHPRRPTQTHQEKTSKKSQSKSQDKSPEKNNKKGGKDEDSGETLAKRAEMLAEDPYMTEAQGKTMDGGSKEKEKKADPADGGGSEKDSEQNEEESEEEKNQRELDILVSRGDKILLNAKGVFPFDFFPDTLTIDANKVNIITKTFFASATVVSVMLKEIMDVRVETALFLGKLSIDYGPHPLKITTIDVPNLRKQDALKAKEIIEGMLVLYRGENIDTTKLKPEQTLDEVIQIGKVDEERA